LRAEKQERKKDMVMGIDPGKNGAVVWRSEGGPVVVKRMPATEGDCVDALRSAMASCCSYGKPSTCYIEKVGGFVKGKSAPGSAMFHFGHGRGVLVGALMTLGFRVIEVTPQKWQGWLGIGKVAGDKHKLKAEAQRRFPEVEVTLVNADALLIFDYGCAMERVNSHE